MSVVIRPETAADTAEVFEVNRRAFAREDEAQLVDALRQGGFVRLSLVAEQQGQLVGHILFSDLPIETKAGVVPALSLAPMAVVPKFQKQGIGSQLVTTGLEECRRLDHKIVAVLGHEHFYPRFGFSAELAKPLVSPFSGDVWMAAELVTGALRNVAGKVRYAPPFGILD